MLLKLHPRGYEDFMDIYLGKVLKKVLTSIWKIAVHIFIIKILVTSHTIYPIEKVVD